MGKTVGLGFGGEDRWISLARVNAFALGLGDENGWDTALAARPEPTRTISLTPDGAVRDVDEELDRAGLESCQEGGNEVVTTRTKIRKRYVVKKLSFRLIVPVLCL